MWAADLAPAGPPLLAVEEVGSERAFLIEAAMGDERDRVAPRVARGCRCFAVMIDRSVAGYGWLSTGPEWIGEIQLEITPRAGEGYVWNCVTLPEHRRKGVFRSLLFGMSDAARRDGLRRLWIGSVAIPAERALPPAGFRPAIRFVSIELGGWHLAFVRRADLALGDEGFGVLNSRAGMRLWRSQPRRH